MPGGGLLSSLLWGKKSPAVAEPPFCRESHPEAERAPRRAFLSKYVEPGGVGAEIGVFWAHFSEVLVAEFRPSKLYLVDPWSKLFGENFRDWGAYTDHGRLKTATAMAAALDLQKRFPDVVEVREERGASFMQKMPEATFDWVYLDAKHFYADVLRDLGAILPRLKPGAVILGDDYYSEDDNQHSGVKQAVDEFAATHDLDLIVEREYQYVLRGRTQNSASRGI